MISAESGEQGYTGTVHLGTYTATVHSRPRDTYVRTYVGIDQSGIVCSKVERSRDPPNRSGPALLATMEISTFHGQPFRGIPPASPQPSRITI